MAPDSRLVVPRDSWSTPHSGVTDAAVGRRRGADVELMLARARARWSVRPPARAFHNASQRSSDADIECPA